MAFESLDDGIARAAKAASDARPKSPQRSPAPCAAASPRVESTAGNRSLETFMLMAFESLDDGIARAAKAASDAHPKSPQRSPKLLRSSEGNRSLETLKEAHQIEMESRWSFPRSVSKTQAAEQASSSPPPASYAKPSSHQPIIASPPASNAQNEKKMKMASVSLVELSGGGGTHATGVPSAPADADFELSTRKHAGSA